MDVKKTPLKKMKIAAIFFLCVLIGGGIYVYRNLSREVALSEARVSEYMKYELFITENTTNADILNLCEKLDTKMIGEVEYSEYKSDTLGDYLVDYKEMIGLATLNKNVHVKYKTTDDKNVALVYWDTGLLHVIVFDEEKDSVIEITPEHANEYKNFRNGINLENYYTYFPE